MHFVHSWGLKTRWTHFLCIKKKTFSKRCLKVFLVCILHCSLLLLCLCWHTVAYLSALISGMVWQCMQNQCRAERIPCSANLVVQPTLFTHRYTQSVFPLKHPRIWMFLTSAPPRWSRKKKWHTTTREIYWLLSQTTKQVSEFNCIRSWGHSVALCRCKRSQWDEKGRVKG